MAQTIEPKKRIIFYGGPKTGKSGALATIPKGSTLWLLDVDRQLGAFSLEWNKRGHSDKNLRKITIDTTKEDKYEIFEEIRNRMWSPPKGFDFYAVDCYTTVGLFITYEVIGMGEDRKYTLQSNTELVSCVTDFFMQFASTVERYDAWLLVTMHEKWQEIADGTVDPADWRNKKQMLAPEVASSARITIPGQCDFIWHLERDRTIQRSKTGPARSLSKSFVRTRGTPLIMASSGGLDEHLNEMELADIGELLKKMKMTWKRTKEPKQLKPTPKKGRKRSDGSKGRYT